MNSLSVRLAQIRRVIVALSGPPRASQKALLPSSRWGGSNSAIKRWQVCAVHGDEEQARGHEELSQALPTRFRVDDEAAQFGPGDFVAFEAEQMQAAFCVELRFMEGLLDDVQVVVWICGVP